MKRRTSVMRKTTLREIRQSFGRWFAIFAIVALGVGFFVGLKITKSMMLATEYEYLKQQSMFDVRLLSTLGFTKEDVKEIAKTDGVKEAKGGYEVDILCEDPSGDYVLKAHSITEDINTPVLKSGRMPEAENECVVDSACAEKVGEVIRVSKDNTQDTKDMLVGEEFVVTGIVDSPYYMNFERGTTSIGNGRVTGFVYLPESAFDSEYFTQILVKGDIDEKCYSKAYDDKAEELKNSLETAVKDRVNLRFENIKSDAWKEIEDAKKELEDKKQEADKKFQDGYEELEKAEKELEDGESSLADAQKKIDDSKESIKANRKQLEAEEKSLLEAKAQCPYEFLPQYAQIQQGLEQVEAGKQQLTQAENTIAEQEKQLESKKQELEEGRETYEKSKKEYEDNKAEYQQEIADAQQKIEDAIQEIEDLEDPDYYVLGRNTNIGYACFESDSDIVDGIANVFPVFFFLVAALVCMTTMNRMVEEQRTQIGVLKALGYGSGKIMSKYLFYSGSAAFLGGIIGFFVGSIIFPSVIWAAYQMMYRMPKAVLVFDYRYAVVSILAALLCSMGTTFFTCKYELMENAAVLIRPKPAKNGKRILLERIPFLWKRMKFLHKVSIRNLVRYKQRFFMMVVGISGCTALLVTGFGVKDSIMNIANEQYSEIQTYDLGVTLKDREKEDVSKQFLSEVEEDTDGVIFSMEKAMDMEVKDKIKSVNLICMDNTQDIDNFFQLRDEKKEKVAYPKKGEAVVTKKLWDKYQLEKGDTINLRDEDMNSFKVTVAGYFENYIYNYVLISNDTYKEAMGEEPEINTAYINILEGKDLHQVAADISGNDNVTAVTVNADIKERFSGMMDSLNYVVILIVVSAGLLAFIVLYNLTNINITERIREIATIKVLGFYPGETASYVFRENLILTAIGAAVGLILGKYFHAFVMARIDIDMINFHVQIFPRSYFVSFALTFVFAGIINAVMFFKLEKINMAESLKSVE